MTRWHDYYSSDMQVAKTQRGIIEYAEGMAQVLAEAGRASQKALGDPPGWAVDKWAEIIRKRAHEILKEERQIENPRALRKS